MTKLAYNAVQSSLTAADQRNAELKGLLLDLTLDDDFPPHWNEAYDIDAAIKPTESGASE